LEKPEFEPQRRTTGPAAGDKGFGVAASPLNSVKFELGVILCVGALLWLAVDSITADLGRQLLILVAYGMAGMVWLIYRTRRVMARLNPEEPGNKRP
jgi:hypothetical protein